MAHNPYAPPSPEADFVNQPVSVAFNDSGTLVVDSSSSQLLQSCLKTGVPTVDHFILDDRVLSRTAAIWAALPFGAIGHAFAKRRWGKPITLQLPLSNDWRIAVSQKATSSWFRVAIGVFALVGGMILSFYHGIFALLGLFGLIGTLIQAYLKGREVDQPFRASRVQENWVWITGASPDVVAKFPPLPCDGLPMSGR